MRRSLILAVMAVLAAPGLAFAQTAGAADPRGWLGPFAVLVAGFAMAFARAVGEYGSVIFIAGNMPMVSEITPLIIIAKLEQYDYAGATAVASVMLAISFVLLLIINGLQSWQRKRSGGAMA